MIYYREIVILIVLIVLNSNISRSSSSYSSGSACLFNGTECNLLLSDYSMILIKYL